MTSALLRQIHKQDQQQLADRYNGDDAKQPRRVWAVDAMKPELDEDEYDAAQRAVRECILFFPGAKANMDRVDMGWSDAGVAKQMDAGHALFGLRQGVIKRCKVRRAPDVVEWLVQLYTLQDIAQGLNHWRGMGPGRPRIPDTRLTRPIVRAVLLSMASYYADCEIGRDNWRGHGRAA